jgi:hypothetical protein
MIIIGIIHIIALFSLEVGQCDEVVKALNANTYMILVVNICLLLFTFTVISNFKNAIVMSDNFVNFRMRISRHQTVAIFVIVPMALIDVVITVISIYRSAELVRNVK